MDKLTVKSISNNRFKILELIGQGSFGNIHKAYDSETKTEIAVKISTRRPGSKQ